MDTSDPDWWKGKCLGKVGFFPSKYITKLQAGERPLQVTHNLQVTDGQDGMRLLRDQVRSGQVRSRQIWRLKTADFMAVSLEFDRFEILKL